MSGESRWRPRPRYDREDDDNGGPPADQVVHGRKWKWKLQETGGEGRHHHRRYTTASDDKECIEAATEKDTARVSEAGVQRGSHRQTVDGGPAFCEGVATNIEHKPLSARAATLQEALRVINNNGKLVRPLSAMVLRWFMDSSDIGLQPHLPAVGDSGVCLVLEDVLAKCRKVWPDAASAASAARCVEAAGQPAIGAGIRQLAKMRNACAHPPPSDILETVSAFLVQHQSKEVEEYNLAEGDDKDYEDDWWKEQNEPKEQKEPKEQQEKTELKELEEPTKEQESDEQEQEVFVASVNAEKEGTGPNESTEKERENEQKEHVSGAKEQLSRERMQERSTSHHALDGAETDEYERNWWQEPTELHGPEEPTVPTEPLKVAEELKKMKVPKETTERKELKEPKELEDMKVPKEMELKETKEQKEEQGEEHGDQYKQDDNAPEVTPEMLTKSDLLWWKSNAKQKEPRDTMEQKGMKKTGEPHMLKEEGGKESERRSWADMAESEEEKERLVERTKMKEKEIAAEEEKMKSRKKTRNERKKMRKKVLKELINMEKATTGPADEELKEADEQEVDSHEPAKRDEERKVNEKTEDKMTANLMKLCEFAKNLQALDTEGKNETVLRLVAAVSSFQNRDYANDMKGVDYLITMSERAMSELQSTLPRLPSVQDARQSSRIGGPAFVPPCHPAPDDDGPPSAPPRARADNRSKVTWVA